MNIPIFPTSNIIDLKRTLNEAEKIYRTPSASSQASKEAMIHHLNAAYHSLHEIKGRCQQIPKGLENVASRIFFLFGKCLYGGDMQASRRMFELALTIQLIGLEALKNTDTPPLLSDNLEELPKQFPSDTTTFHPLDDLLATMPGETIVDIAKGQNKEDAFNFAASMRWLAATYQNIDSFHSPERVPLFEKVLGVASNIWKLIGLQGDTEWKKDCDWEVAQIIYNSKRFIHYLQHPGDVKGALETLKEVEPYLALEGNSLRAQQMRAQIHNITGIEISNLESIDPKEKLENLKLCYEEAAKAEKIAAETPEFDPFLKVLFLNNKASRALECLQNGFPAADIDEIHGWFNQVVETVEKEKYNHYYHSSFMINAAKCEIYKQHWKEAFSDLDKAQLIAGMYPASSTDMNAKIEKVRLQLLQELVKKGSSEDVERFISSSPSYFVK